MFVVARAAREVGALGVHPRVGAIANPIAVFIHVAIEGIEVLQLLFGQDLAAVRLVAVVPLEPGTHPVVHADVEIGYDDDRCLQSFRQIEGLDREVKAFLGVGGEQQHMPRVAV